MDGPGVLIPQLGWSALDLPTAVWRHLARLACRLQPPRGPVVMPDPQVELRGGCVWPPVGWFAVGCAVKRRRGRWPPVLRDSGAEGPGSSRCLAGWL